MAAKTLTPETKKGKTPADVKEQPYPYPFFALLNDMNKMIDNFFRDFGMAPAHEGRRTFNPSVDVHDSGGEITVTAELPGMRQEDIEVSLTKNSLTLKGEKKSKKEEKGKGAHLLERTFGAFARTITLPVEVNVDKTKAAFKNGVLTITLPKAERVLKETKKISVESE
jgi:HSP20 family protein